MAMLVTGTNKDILKICTDEFSIYISGNSENKKFRATNNNKNISGYMNVISSYEDTKTYTINNNLELELNDNDNMLPSFFEDGIYDIYFENETKDVFEIYHIDKEINDNLVSRGRNIYGSFRFNGDIGYSTFKILKNKSEVLSFTIQVFPTKLDYMDDYNKILKDINDEINSLTFDFMSKTFSSVDIKDIPSKTNLEFIVILDKIFDKLDRSIKRIERHPKHGVLTEYNLKDKHRSKAVSTKETIKLWRKSKSRDKVVEVKKITTLDIYENQYVKYMIKRILNKINHIKFEIGNKKGTDNLYYKKLKTFETRLSFNLNTFYKDISDISTNKSMSLVFKMASGYKEVYFYYSMLSKSLDICSGLYDISNKKLWNLYEIWCYISIHNIIKELGYKPKTSSIIQTTSNGITLSLMQSKKSKCIYEDSNKNKIELWYNKPYYGLPTTNQRPDTVLCLKGDKFKNRTYIFDAKYRLYIDNNGVIGPMEDDINIMHRYRDAIVSHSKDMDSFRYDTFGAYVMFPCSDEKSFESHPYYKSIDKVNIGAIPMLPGSTSLMKKHMYKLLNESYIEAVNNNPVFDENDDYYKFKNQNVMIVNVKDRIHFEKYKEYKFYHIPKTSLSKVKLGIEYLAFYQPKSKFNNDSGIYYFAKIKDIIEYKRGSCTELKYDESKKDHTYIRFELDEFKYIGPISSVEYGPRIFNYTTMYLLSNASTMHELYLKSRKEVEIYKDLKKISEEKGLKLRKENDGFYIGDEFTSINKGGD